jgi:hypothetical protein
MSHFVTINTQIRDVAALRDACGELGLQVLDNSTARGYATAHTPGEHVIRLRGPYDIALNRESKDQPFGLTTDWWNGKVEKEVGKDYGRLLQLYGVHKASREAKRRGHTVRRAKLKDGTIKLSIGGLTA